MVPRMGRGRSGIAPHRDAADDRQSPASPGRARSTGSAPRDQRARGLRPPAGGWPHRTPRTRLRHPAAPRRSACPGRRDLPVFQRPAALLRLGARTLQHGKLRAAPRRVVWSEAPGYRCEVRVRLSGGGIRDRRFRWRRLDRHARGRPQPVKPVRLVRVARASSDGQRQRDQDHAPDGCEMGAAERLRHAICL